MIRLLILSQENGNRFASKLILSAHMIEMQLTVQFRNEKNVQKMTFVINLNAAAPKLNGWRCLLIRVLKKQLFN